MLAARRTLAVLVVLGTLLVAGSAPAGADPVCTKYDDYTGFCLVWAENDPGGGAGSGSGAGTGSGSGSGGAGGGSGSQLLVDGQWCTPGGLADPQPPLSDPVWGGHTDGAIYDCMAGLAGSGTAGVMAPPVTLRFWSSSAPPPPPDPRALAQQAVDSMGLQAVRIGIVPLSQPDAVGLVGMPNWMWVDAPDAATFGPNTASASSGGWTVTATARVDRVTWDMGDGQVVACGPGTPYKASYGQAASPDCGHVYTKQGGYTVTATSHWVVTWSGIGQAGTITMDLSRSAPVTIGEVQVLSQ